METAIEVQENIGSFIQIVTAFRPDNFTLIFFMNLTTIDSSASELVEMEGRGGKKEEEGRVG